MSPKSATMETHTRPRSAEAAIVSVSVACRSLTPARTGTVPDGRRGATALPPDRRATTTLPRHSARRGARFIFGFFQRPPDAFDARRRDLERDAFERGHVLLVARRTHPRDVLRFGLPLGPFADFKVGAFWPAVFEGSPRRVCALLRCDAMAVDVDAMTSRVRWLVATH